MKEIFSQYNPLGEEILRIVKSNKQGRGTYHHLVLGINMLVLGFSTCPDLIGGDIRVELSI